MNKLDYEKEFEDQGLIFEYGKDEPGKIYPHHRHGWTKLVTLAGSITMTLGNSSTFVQGPGDICEIESGQLHKAVVGPDGWDWLAAWRPDENDTFINHE